MLVSLTMIDINTAYERLSRHVKTGPEQEVALRDGLFRTLAEPVCCDVDFPPFDRAVMDGFVVRSADVADAPVTLSIVGQIPAGERPATSLMPGQAFQINTGAPIPSGADAVVRVEKTEESADHKSVVIREPVPVGTFITPRATYLSAGAVVLQRGTRLTPAEIGAAAAAGAACVRVYRRPTVAVLATGDELIDIDRTPTGAQIRNSNEWLIEAMVRSAHADPVRLGVSRDHRAGLREAIVEGLRSDVLCITGGISMGALDFVPEVLEECGVSFHIHKLAIKPGRPTIFGTAKDGTPVFALPGNPGGAFVGFELLVRPSLAAMEGRSGEWPIEIGATLLTSVKPTSDRRTYIPAQLMASGDGGLEVKPVPWHGSGDTFGLATVNALIVRPPDSAGADEGDSVRAIPLDRFY